jgi:hypothetical protein
MNLSPTPPHLIGDRTTKANPGLGLGQHLPAQTGPHTRLQQPLRLVGFVIVGVCVALAGCGSGTSASESSDGKRGPSAAAALEVTFRRLTPGSDSAAMVDYDAVVQSGKVRLSTVGYPDGSESHPYPAKTYVYDGSRQLIHDTENELPYQLFENAVHAKWPGSGGTEPALAAVAQFLPFDPRADYSRWLCPKATRLQDGVDLGRPAVQYSCLPTGVNRNSDTVWVDKAFGIVLGPLVPAGARFIAKPRIDATTFSTAAPAGPKVDVIATGPQPGDQAPAFTVTEVPAFGSKDKAAVGRPISSSEFAGRPYVLAFFDGGILFDPEGPQTSSLRRLDELTAGGTTPTVLGVLITASDFVDKGGLFKRKGWHFRIASDGGRLQHKFGFSDLLDFAFINGDGAISALHSGDMSKSQLQTALARLNDNPDDFKGCRSSRQTRTSHGGRLFCAGDRDMKEQVR